MTLGAACPAGQCVLKKAGVCLWLCPHKAPLPTVLPAVGAPAGPVCWWCSLLLHQPTSSLSIDRVYLCSRSEQAIPWRQNQGRNASRRTSRSPQGTRSLHTKLSGRQYLNLTPVTNEGNSEVELVLSWSWSEQQSIPEVTGEQKAAWHCRCVNEPRKGCCSPRPSAPCPPWGHGGLLPQPVWWHSDLLHAVAIFTSVCGQVYRPMISVPAAPGTAHVHCLYEGWI